MKTFKEEYNNLSKQEQEELKEAIKKAFKEHWNVQCNWNIPTVGLIEIGPFCLKARTGSLKARLLMTIKKIFVTSCNN